jgi:hypothetical protein
MAARRVRQWSLLKRGGPRPPQTGPRASVASSVAAYFFISSKSTSSWKVHIQSLPFPPFAAL